MKNKFGWGTNPFYFLAGKFGIHPTFVQEILTDTRYNEVDRLTTIKYLKVNPNKKFSVNVRGFRIFMKIKSQANG